MNTLRAENLSQLQRIIHEHDAVTLRGGGSKPALSSTPNHVPTLDLSALSGVIEYEPDEYTFTAYAGTPISEIQLILAQKNQYLPFDPIFVDSGATLGGTVAANTSGAGRWRYGGIRDFILGIRFIDGKGRVIRSGGKVVKNAAGFDLPKFFVGSMGCFGILAEISFKVFPKPMRYRTLQFTYPDIETAVEAIHHLTTSPLETDAIDIYPVDRMVQVLIRIGGLEAALHDRLQRLIQFMQKDHPAEQQEIENEESFWHDANHFRWCAEEPFLVKVPIPSGKISYLESRINLLNLSRRYSAGGNIAWIAGTDISTLQEILQKNNLTGLVIRGSSDFPILGTLQGMSLALRIKQVLDPMSKFPEIAYAPRN